MPRRVKKLSEYQNEPPVDEMNFLLMEESVIRLY